MCAGVLCVPFLMLSARSGASSTFRMQFSRECFNF